MAFFYLFNFISLYTFYDIINVIKYYFVWKWFRGFKFKLFALSYIDNYTQYFYYCVNYNFYKRTFRA